MDLTVITSTRNRPALLEHCLHQFRSQFRGGLRCEMLVVSDGPDPVAAEQALRAGVRWIETPIPLGKFGSGAKDAGIAGAGGRYVCFWDDDNIYEPHALVTLFGAAVGYDIGVVRVCHRFRERPGTVTLPRRWCGLFVPGDVDTMCVCVRTELARRELWCDATEGPGTDFRWLRKLEAHRPSIRYVPIVIGTHV